MFIISWIDGALGQPVDARLHTEDAALELAACMSIGGDATVVNNDGHTISEWKYEDGQQVSFTNGPSWTDLGAGWKAAKTLDGGMELRNSVIEFALTPNQVNRMKELMK